MSNIIEAISIPKKFFTLSGHWPGAKTTIFQRILFCLEILFSLSLLAELTNHFDDYEILSEHLSITISPTSYLIKLIIFKFKSDAVQHLISSIKLKEFNNCPKHLRDIIEETVKYSKFLGHGYQLLCFVTVLLYSLVPVFTKADLPVKFSYNTGNFKPVMYAFQVIGMVSTASNNSSMDILAMSLMRICAAQIEILNRKIIGLSDEKYRSDHIKTKLKECVKHHMKIIRYHKLLNKVFSMIILTQYATSAVVICNLGFQLVHVNPKSLQFVRMTVYFIAMMIQLAMYCWFGNEIIAKVMAGISSFLSPISDACYEFKWFESDLETRKTIITIMERSKQPLFLKVEKFSILSLQAFTSVIRTSYSYFTLMQTMYQKNQN
nr:odorant receptor 13a-like [Leptinotarsa decemlineata]